MFLMRCPSFQFWQKGLKKLEQRGTCSSNPQRATSLCCPSPHNLLAATKRSGEKSQPLGLETLGVRKWMNSKVLHTSLPSCGKERNMNVCYLTNPGTQNKGRPFPKCLVKQMSLSRVPFLSVTKQMHLKLNCRACGNAYWVKDSLSG